MRTTETQASVTTNSIEEKNMFAKKLIRKEISMPVLYQCEDCQGNFGATDLAECCPYCLSTNRSNLIILHMEETEERAEWLSLVDFAAGD